MMHRLCLPDCTVCGSKGSAYWESSLWPTLRICHTCRDAVIEWFFDEGINQHLFLSSIVQGTSYEGVSGTGFSEEFYVTHSDGVLKRWRVYHSLGL